MTEDEYSKILEEALSTGFLFPCSESHLNRPVYLSAEEIEAMPESSGNPTPIFIRCKRCDRIMTYHHGRDKNADGKWRCEGCGRTVRENTPYQLLEKINREFEKKLFGKKI